MFNISISPRGQRQHATRDIAVIYTETATWGIMISGVELKLQRSKVSSIEYTLYILSCLKLNKLLDLEDTQGMV